MKMSSDEIWRPFVECNSQHWRADGQIDVALPMSLGRQANRRQWIAILKRFD
jgi:hypothetical protein